MHIDFSRVVGIFDVIIGFNITIQLPQTCVLVIVRLLSVKAYEPLSNIHILNLWTQDHVDWPPKSRLLLNLNTSLLLVIKQVAGVILAQQAALVRTPLPLFGGQACRIRCLVVPFVVRCCGSGENDAVIEEEIVNMVIRFLKRRPRLVRWREATGNCARILVFVK